MGDQNGSMKTVAKQAVTSVSSIVTWVIILAVDILLGYITFRLASMGYIPLTVVFIIIILLISSAFLIPKLSHLRWMAVGLSAWLLFSIFPILFTIYNAFTNYGDGHLISKEQAIEQISKQNYLPETGKAYSWVAYRSEDNDYLLWLKDDEGNTFLARPVESAAEDKIIDVVPGENGIGELDDDGAPTTIEGYTRLNRIIAATDQNLTNIKFGDVDNTIQVRSPSEAAELQSLFAYDPEENTFTNQETGTIYYDQEGTWTARDGSKLIPGYNAVIGFDNFVEFATSPGLRGPLVTIVT
jgi:hypothetical protein